ncbi:MAG: DUF1217 domain-containing protein [Hyphomonadaceae bacterium]|nr:DUF1217 domain-containing protein [Hyphomonadaceae bacterium]
MFQPAIPVSGYGGWKFLQTTYSSQLENFADAPQIKNDRAYLEEKLADPISTEDFLNDRRLLRITLTAFDLGGEEWKRGFIDKVLEEAADPESTFLARLNNPAYSAFAEAFTPLAGHITVLSDGIAELGDKFETASFRQAVGEVDNNMRLSLNYQSRIVDLVGAATNEEAVLYRLLGDVPVRTVLETAMNLPTDMRKLPIEQQAGILKDRLGSTLGIHDLSDLTSLDRIDRVLQRFHAMDAINQGVTANSPGATALTLLGNAIGASASQNLFLSQFI